MRNKFLDRLEQNPHRKDLFQLWTKKLNNSNMQSLLIETFRIRFRDADSRTWDLVDGGFTDWTQLLLTSRKERFLSSAIGSELLLRVFPGILNLLGGMKTT
jgi:hypothetical protein